MGSTFNNFGTLLLSKSGVTGVLGDDCSLTGLKKEVWTGSFVGSDCKSDWLLNEGCLVICSGVMFIAALAFWA